MWPLKFSEEYPGGSNYIVIDINRINIAMMKDGKCVLLFDLNKFIRSLILLLRGIEEDVFTRPMATY